MSRTSLPLTQSVFTILSALIEDKLGLHFDAEDRELLAEKLSPRALDRGFDSLLDYYYYLRYDGGAEGEVDALAETLVVNETYFARESDQLLALCDKLLPAILRERGRARLWSAACSTGEEPLTLAGMLNDRGLLSKVDIVASDLNARVLAHARAGNFSGRSLRALPAAADAWLDRAGQKATIKPALARAVTFQQLNLRDVKAVEKLGAFDVILCRNVLIYFRDATIKAVVATLSRQLVRGGYLLVGASESLLRFGVELGCEEHGGAFFYRKVAP